MRRLIAICASFLLATSAIAQDAMLMGAGSPSSVASGGGSVAVTATGTKKYKSASTSFSDATVITIPGGSNAVVCTAVFGYTGAAPTGVSATWNSVTMTFSAHLDRSGGSASTYVFGLRSPATGAQTLAIGPWTNSAEVFVDCVALSGVNVTNDGTAFPHSASSDTGSQTVAVTSATGNIVVDALSPNATATLTGTTLYTDFASGAVINAASNYDVGAATVNIGTVTGGTAVSQTAVDVAH